MSSDQPSRKLWIAAAVAALTLHLVCVAFAVVRSQDDDQDDELGAPGLEVSLELAAPRLAPTDLPPGPDQDASAASPAVVEQKAVLKESDLPKDTPTQTDDPDRLVTLNNSKKPEKEDPKVAESQATPSQESVAAEATAMPTSDTLAESAQSLTREQGTGASKQRIKTTWQKELFAQLDKHKRYPSERNQQAAKIVVNFVLDRLGHVVSTSVVEGSGDPAFDAAALDMVRRSDPLPPPPPVIADDGLSFTLPVIFRVRSKS